MSVLFNGFLLKNVHNYSVILQVIVLLIQSNYMNPLFTRKHHQNRKSMHIYCSKRVKSNDRQKKYTYLPEGDKTIREIYIPFMNLF